MLLLLHAVTGAAAAMSQMMAAMAAKRAELAKKEDDLKAAEHRLRVKAVGEEGTTVGTCWGGRWRVKQYW